MILPPRILLDMYRRGVFPMADDDGSIGVYDPPRRGIIPLDEFHIPDSLRKTVASHRFEIRFDTSFDAVIRGCAEREETWLSQDLMDSYINLHMHGHAHSVEAWRGGELAGGLYGVHLGGAFFGESMFHVQRDASKVALVALVAEMRRCDMTLLDTQYVTPHLQRFGAREIPRATYRSMLFEAVHLVRTFPSASPRS